MKKKRKRQKGILTQNWKKIVPFLFILMIVLFAIKIIRPDIGDSLGRVVLSDEEINAEKPEMKVDLLTVNPYSRVGKEVDEINGIVIHYTANPGASAQNNRDYFENLKDTHSTRASSHFIVGLEGEIVQCIPTWEIAYASNDRNSDTISIECCHPDESGKFTKETYQSMVQLTAWLCEKFGLTEDDVIRHYDITGKNCPKYFVEDEEAWNDFKGYIEEALSRD